MKRLVEALQDFAAAQDEQHRASKSQARRPPTRDYATRRRLSASNSSSPPILAVHYAPDAAFPSSPGPSSLHLQSFLASPETSLPTAFLPDTNALIVDTGASISVTYARSDFIGPIRAVQPTTLQGIGAGLPVAGIGTAQFVFLASDGTPISIRLSNTLYVPESRIRLLCPPHLAESTN
jgi:hypothetical protein